MKMRQN